jgi:hypothetical protein
MSSAKFTKNLLSKYQVISEPGTFLVSVSSTVLPDYLIEDGEKSRYIVYLRCGTEENLKTALKTLGDAEEILFSFVAHNFMTGVLWKTNENKLYDHLPTKNEQVLATFEYVEDKLTCTNIHVLPLKNLDYFDLNEWCNIRSKILNLLKH